MASASAQPQATTHRPEELRYSKTEKVLEILFENGETLRLPAELLRVESPSAEVQGHGPGEKVLVAGRRHVGIMRLDPVGHYAVQIVFDDMHETGIYTWDYLYEMGKNQDAIWAEYVKGLEEAGLSRDP